MITNIIILISILLAGYGLFWLGWEEHKARTKWVEGVEKRALEILRNQEVERERFVIFPFYFPLLPRSQQLNLVEKWREMEEREENRYETIINKINKSNVRRKTKM